MFERFTDRARRTVVLSQEIAASHGSSYIETDHLLSALYDEGEGVAAVVLKDLHYAPIPRGDGKISGHMPFTEESKTVIQRSLREALQLGHNYIGTEHILLALVREAPAVLEYEHLNPLVVRRTVIAKLTGYGSAATRGMAVPEAKVDLMEYPNGMRLPAAMYFIMEGDHITTPVGPFASEEDAEDAYLAHQPTSKKYIGEPEIRLLLRPNGGVPIPESE